MIPIKVLKTVIFGGKKEVQVHSNSLIIQVHFNSRIFVIQSIRVITKLLNSEPVLCDLLNVHEKGVTEEKWLHCEGKLE